MSLPLSLPFDVGESGAEGFVSDIFIKKDSFFVDVWLSFLKLNRDFDTFHTAPYSVGLCGCGPTGICSGRKDEAYSLSYSMFLWWLQAHDEAVQWLMN